MKILCYFFLLDYYRLLHTYISHMCVNNVYNLIKMYLSNVIAMKLHVVDIIHVYYVSHLEVLERSPRCEVPYI